MAYQFECEREGCTFLVQSEADDEVAKLARAHARLAHRGRFSPADLERRIERIEAA